ncbi:hypothetical protein BN77_0328 [Rhizobium mesoamericanum STM3625]|uniref:Uncharacterized protein n=1 Tax=Rhizobium mesoamericanum STM3625 TaxID=1211777 RepID=K0Q0F0_9HYPH|nr:hypothetical protein BN77_0328 [Rhizobium mesoamericanum STM3625]
MDGPILIMLAALIPVSDTLRTTGGSELIAGWARPICGPDATLRRIGADTHHRHGGNTVPQQCGNGSGNGTNCGKLRPNSRLPARGLPDGGRHWGGLRLLNADRPPM